MIIHCRSECVCVWLLVLKIMFEIHHFCYKNTVKPWTTEVWTALAHFIWILKQINTTVFTIQGWLNSWMPNCRYQEPIKVMHIFDCEGSYWHPNPHNVQGSIVFYHTLTHSTICGLLACFQSKTSRIILLMQFLNIFLGVYVHMYKLGMYLRVELLDCKICICSILVDNVK